ncbi:MAG: hypothetical protein BWY06_02978 [Candidatus Latescibacteria bacterium ADurb.Bin168]|nr:MAG: hypothetical protein BWY06_02978 [Candidatus Latescibacteria bacterium ADurb.Bin168]
MEQLDYMTFLVQKQQSARPEGIKRIKLPDRMFDFQRHLTEWALTQGRSAIFADCGMGKSLMLMSWAENVVRETNKPVLVVTPLAVTAQIIREAEKFGIEAHRSNDGKPSGDITVTNYEKLDKFDWKDYSGVVCDESSRIKCADAATRQLVTAFTRKVPYRLLCTATAAPNDYIELGTSSEALGYLGFMDMLNRFFKNDNNNSGMRRMYGEMPKWRFRGHAELPFWRWVCSWARALRKPSDLGFSDDGFILPALCEREHLVRANNKREGFLFEIPARDLREQREEAKRTIRERCERVADLVAHDQPAFVLCHLNDEGDLLEKIIPDAVQVSGSDSDERKEERLLGFADGKIRVLITKPKIGAHGLNFQHCNQVVFFPSHSYEQYYQGVRRCWRFGQKRSVTVDIVLTEGERKVMLNLQRKAKDADRMFDNLVSEMNHAVGIERVDKMTHGMEVPVWLS